MFLSRDRKTPLELLSYEEALSYYLCVTLDKRERESEQSQTDKIIFL